MNVMPQIPQGLSDEQFAAISVMIRAATTHLGSDIQFHGSRVKGTARLESDIDIAIRLPSVEFEAFLLERFGVPNPGSAKERTMLWARERGKIQAGEASLRALRNELEVYLGIEVDISVIRLGGPFDRPPFLPLKAN
jgi:predicted nucleotidyltransferase